MRATVGEVELEYELFGPEDGDPIVLISGIFQQLTFWPEAFIATLADAGMRVLAFDNRDVGRSSFESRPAPDLLAVIGGDLSGVNYTLSDMAADTAGLIEAAGFSSAHVLGHSMGGMIAQRPVIEHPERVRTVTLCCTAPLDGVTGQPAPVFAELLFTAPPATPEGRFQRVVDAYRLCEMPDPVDEDAVLAYAHRQEGRAPNPSMQCMQAIFASMHAGFAASPSHLDQLATITHATLVVHGVGDLLVGEDGGERLASLIPRADLVLIDGMGHIPQSPKRWDEIADEVITHVEAG